MSDQRLAQLLDNVQEYGRWVIRGWHNHNMMLARNRVIIGDHRLAQDEEDGQE